jgi:PilZ domain-containing protein
MSIEERSQERDPGLPHAPTAPPATLLRTGRHVRLVEGADDEPGDDVCLGVIAVTTGRAIRIRLVDPLPETWALDHVIRLEVLSEGAIWSAQVRVTYVPDPPIWLECSRPHLVAARERRAHPRIACRLPVRVQRLRPNGVDPSAAGRACDLGQGGMLLAGVDLSVGDVVELDVLDDVLDLRHDVGLADAGSVLTVRGLVVGSRSDAAGTHYAHIAFASLADQTEHRLQRLLAGLTTVDA